MQKMTFRATSALSRALPLLCVLVFCHAFGMPASGQNTGALAPPTAGDITLRSLSPQVRIWNPSRANSASSLQASAAGARLDLPSESIVTYSVPPNVRSLSGVATYVTPGATYPAEDRRNFNRVRVRFLVDGIQALDLHFDRETPPQAFTLPLNGGRQVTLQTESEFDWATVSLSPLVFSIQPATTTTRHLMESGKAMVDVAPEPRQFYVHVYYAGEDVPVTLEPATTSAQQVVSISLRSASHSVGAPVTFMAQSHGSDPVHVGVWTVPQTLGPATLDVTVRGSGQTLYSSEKRIVVVQPPNPAVAANPMLGVHISSSGYPMLQDEFASVWGAQWARVFLRWELIERNEGQYDFSGADALVNAYSAQPMKLLMVLGESAPAWAGGKDAPRPAAFAKFVEAAVRRYQGKVGAWDVYNEIDAKKVSSGDATVLLQQGIGAIRRNDASATIVCCSLGSSSWLSLNAALRGAGIFRSVTAASMHPYMQYAPEQRDGFYNYPEMIDALRSVTGVGSAGAVWSSEANWLVGLAGTDPSITDHLQAEYVVRVSLLSIAAGVPYFVHMPFFYGAHPEIFVDNLAAYHAMASFFAGARNAKLQSPAKNVYAVTAQSGADSIGAVWTSSSRTGTVRIAGSSPVQFFDFYGNSRSSAQGTVEISGEPVYFRAPGGQTSSITVIQPPPLPAFKPLPDLSTWKRNAKSTYTQQPSGGVSINSAQAKYDHQLQSTLLTLQPQSCYILRAKLRLITGGSVYGALDAEGKALGRPMFVAAAPETAEHVIETRFRSDHRGQASIIVSSGNPNGPAPSEFTFSDPEIALCD